MPIVKGSVTVGVADLKPDAANKCTVTVPCGGDFTVRFLVAGMVDKDGRIDWKTLNAAKRKTGAQPTDTELGLTPHDALGAAPSAGWTVTPDQPKTGTAPPITKGRFTHTVEVKFACDKDCHVTPGEPQKDSAIFVLRVNYKYDKNPKDPKDPGEIAKDSPQITLTCDKNADKPATTPADKPKAPNK
jgi:hypothetical protein